MKKRVVAISLIAGLGFACAPSPAMRVLLYRDVAHRFAPTSPGAVMLFRREPLRPHLRFAEIVFEVEPGMSRATVERRLREKAARLGAHGLVLVWDGAWREPVVTTGAWTPRAAYRDRALVGVAIRFL